MAFRSISFIELLERVHSGQQEEWLAEPLQQVSVSELDSNIVPVWGKNVVVGRFYLYKYFPKHYKTLPSYDQLPVTLVLEKYNGGFLGINFHHYGRIGIYNNMIRNLLIGKIISRLQGTQRVIINYQLLKRILNNNRLLKLKQKQKRLLCPCFL